MNPTTQIYDAILDGVSENVDSDELVRSVEWAAMEDARAAMLASPIANFDEYLAVGGVDE